ncbi:hypothetical protein [uncultured Sphingomonas sp.]|uniref:hypothetical protein n=1 Tax=uncultured Sphingomonas sp. TaxID=158754 RepID=UPI0025F0A9B1|nr:hypothetical protein [uncultured Sphingomonas sp.]
MATSAVRLSEDLLGVVQLMSGLSDELTADSAMLARHATGLQNFDNAIQTITAVAASLVGGGAQEGSRSRLENLRASCREALARYV